MKKLFLQSVAEVRMPIAYDLLVSVLFDLPFGFALVKTTASTVDRLKNESQQNDQHRLNENTNQRDGISDDVARFLFRLINLS